MFNCGIIFGLCELFGSESLSQVYCFMVWLLNNSHRFPKSWAYDDGFHLHKFVKKPRQCDSTEAAKVLSELGIVVDRMHFKNHVSAWCKAHMNPDSNKSFHGVNTEACEQTFYWVARFKHAVRHMNSVLFNLFLLTACNMFNNTKLKRRF